MEGGEFVNGREEKALVRERGRREIGEVRKGDEGEEKTWREGWRESRLTP